MILIGGILLWWMYSTKPEVDPNATTNTEQVTESTKADTSSTANFSPTIESDSLKNANLQNRAGLGALGALGEHSVHSADSGEHSAFGE